MICTICQEEIPAGRNQCVDPYTNPEGVHCGSRACVLACEACQEWIGVVVAGAPKVPKEEEETPRDFPMEDVTPEMIEEARKRRVEDDKLFGPGSRTMKDLHGERWVGPLVEDRFKRWAGEKVHDNRRNKLDAYDFRVHELFLDVKGQPVKGKPRVEYGFSIHESHVVAKRFSTAFVFVWYGEFAGTKGGPATFLLGWLPKLEFMRGAVYLREGERYPAVGNVQGQIVKANCYNIRIFKIWPIETMLLGAVKV